MAAVIVAWEVDRGAVATGTPILADDVNPFAGIMLEAIATFFVVLVFLGTVVDRRAPATVYPLAIGLTIAVGIFATGTFTGGALNPARAFGPALVGGAWGGTAAWLIGPLLGGVLAWAVYEYLIAPRPEITNLSAQVHHGHEFEIETPSPSDIAKVVLVRPMAVTHQTDSEQRVVQLTFNVSGASKLRAVLAAARWRRSA